jgi:uncharacterized protein
MKEERVVFTSGELRLEGLLAEPAAGRDASAALVCHPHPLYGGSMHNNVVEAIVAALHQHGFLTLRFNFRGVGASEGAHDAGRGEVNDALAALSFVSHRSTAPLRGATLAGYSFGARVALLAASRASEIERLILVALPLAADEATFEGLSNKRTLLIAGDRDPFCPEAKLIEIGRRLEGCETRIIRGADHFFAGREGELADAIGAWLGPT